MLWIASLSIVTSAINAVCRSFVRLCAGLLQSNQPISLAYKSEELVNFWWCPGPGYRFRITCPQSTSISTAEYGILDLLAFLIQSPADFHDTRRPPSWILKICRFCHLALVDMPTVSCRHVIWLCNLK